MRSWRKTMFDFQVESEHLQRITSVTLVVMVEEKM